MMDQDDIEAPPVHAQMTQARTEGWGWGDILGYLGQASQAAAAEGYTPAEIDAHLGYQPPDQLASGLHADMLQRLQEGQASEGGSSPFEAASADAVKTPTGAPDVTPEAAVNPLPPGHPVARLYADALNSGATRSPQEFADAYTDGLYTSTATTLDEVHRQAAAAGLAQQLPSFEDTTDHAIALAADGGGPVDPALVGVARSNLLDFWAQTGERPSEVTGRVDPLLHDALTQPHPDFPTLRDLEQHGRDAIEPAALPPPFLDPLGVYNTVKSLLQFPMAYQTFAEKEEQAKVDFVNGKTDFATYYNVAKQNPALDLLAGTALGALGFKAGQVLKMGAQEALTPNNLFQVLNDESGSLKPGKYELERGVDVGKAGDIRVAKTVPFVPPEGPTEQLRLFLDDNAAKQGSFYLRGGRLPPASSVSGPESLNIQSQVAAKAQLDAQVMERWKQLTLNVDPEAAEQFRLDFRKKLPPEIRGQYQLFADEKPPPELALVGGGGKKSPAQALNTTAGAAPGPVSETTPYPKYLLPPDARTAMEERAPLMDTKHLGEENPEQLALAIRPAIQKVQDTQAAIVGKLGNARRGSDGTVELPPAVADVRRAIGKVDASFQNLARNATGDHLDLQNSAFELPMQMRGGEFQAKVRDSVESRLVNPAHVHEPEVQAYLDMVKPITDRQTQLYDNIQSKLAGTEFAADARYTHGLTTEQGYVRHLMKARDVENPLDPNLNPDVLTGMSPGLRRNTLKSPSLNPSEMFVVDDHEGNRQWSQRPLSETGWKIGDKFRDAETGRERFVSRPTTAEIEANTKLKMHDNFDALLRDNVAQLGRVDRLLDHMTALKEEMVQKGLYSETQAPGLTKVEGLPTFGGGYIEPRLGDAVKRMFVNSTGDLEQIFGRVNKVIMNSLFISPVVHALNVGAHGVQSRGLEWVNPMGYGRGLAAGITAFHHVLTMHPDYIEHVRLSSGLLYGSTKMRMGGNYNFLETLLSKVHHEQLAQDNTWGTYAKTLGFASVPDMVKSELRWSNRSLWFLGDWMLYARELELQSRFRMFGKPLDRAEAVRQAERDIPNYQVPSEVMRSPLMSKILQSPAFGLFGRYHHGLVKGQYLIARDLLRGDPERASFYERNVQARAEAMGKVAATLGVAYLAWPVINAGLQALTANPDAELRKSGPFAVYDGLKGMLTGQKSFFDVMGRIMTLSPVINIAKMASAGIDNYGNKITGQFLPWKRQAVQGLEAAAKQFYPGQLLAEMMKPGGTAKAIGKLVGVDLPAPGDKERQRKWEIMEQRMEQSRAGKDPIQQLLQQEGVVDPLPAAGRVPSFDPPQPRQSSPRGGRSGGRAVRPGGDTPYHNPRGRVVTPGE